MTKAQVNLDDVGYIRGIDQADMLKAIASFAGQCSEAVEIGREAKLTIDASGIANVLVLGMGGSGISGDVCRVLFADALKIPLTVNRHYRLPAYVGPATLVLAVSYSGNTEETLSGLSEAVDAGAQVAVTSSGGKISKIASDRGFTLITIPSGLQPRAALGYLSLPLAVLLERLELVGSLENDLAETVKTIRDQSSKLGVEVPESVNLAKKLARRMYGRMPVIYGSEGPSGLAAFRFKCQINENSKTPSHWNLLPELDHNELAGWQMLKEISDQFYLIFLRDDDEHPQIKKRVKATRDLIAEQFGGFDEVWSAGKSKLARLFSLIHLGDFASTYLALLNNVDPTPVERIELLKLRLQEERASTAGKPA